MEHCLILNEGGAILSIKRNSELEWENKGDYETLTGSFEPWNNVRKKEGMSQTDFQITSNSFLMFSFKFYFGDIQHYKDNLY